MVRRAQGGQPDSRSADGEEPLSKEKSRQSEDYQHAVTCFEAGDLMAAEELLLGLLQMSPDVDAARLLARIYWLDAQHDAFLALCEESLHKGPLQFLAVELLRQSGQLDKALSSLANLPEVARKDLRFFLSAAWIYSEQGDGARAYECAHRAFEVNQGEATTDAYLTSLLMTGRYQLAETAVSKLLSESPRHCRWWAYSVVLQRLLTQNADNGLRRLIGQCRLASPKSDSNHAALNEALRATLRERHLFKQRPLDQSLRNGIQTAANLVGAKDNALREYLALSEDALSRYLLDVAPRHPFLHEAKPSDLAISECWGVRLSGGMHVPHFHPEGVVSGTYYVTVPTAPEKGAIYFGVPPFDIPDRLEPLDEITPVEGLLLLFPSFLFHGTRAAASGSIRETIPFDAHDRSGICP